MTSTEQKNVVQPFIDSCYTFGILPTILTGAFDDYSLNTGELPFTDLGPTSNFGHRLRSSKEPLADARRMLPVLCNARPYTRVSPLLLRLCSDSQTFSGNQAVLRLCEVFIDRLWGLSVQETRAFKHAKTHVVKIAGLLAPGSYSRPERLISSYSRLKHGDRASYFRKAADVIDFIRKRRPGKKEVGAVRRWNARARQDLNFRTSYRKEGAALDAYRNFTTSAVHSLNEPPAVVQRWITTRKASRTSIAIYQYGQHTIIRINRVRSSTSRLYSGEGKRARGLASEASRGLTETHFLSSRDMDDLRFLLQSMSQVHLYNSRRLMDCIGKSMKTQLVLAQGRIWEAYVGVLRKCASKWHLRNKLGVYFDVIQWRYLAWKSGDVFYNHSDIMAQKVESKGLQELPSQASVLETLKALPMDQAIDLMGIYKASIYPEVDPFDVVVQQRKLHYSRHQTDWDPTSHEGVRFSETKAYMWYFGARAIYNRKGTWPGRIRQGVEEKDWHKDYYRNGIPGDRWRESHDVDLTGAVPVADISNEQYIRQQDSACAPPDRREYESFQAMRSAPRRHRRKLLYAIQEPQPPDLSVVLEGMNSLGRSLPDGYVGEVKPNFKFSTDIVTGSRCERHKDAPRPFYAASPPWGCILSYFDGITRDFLNNIPQSMLGKSTKQKYTDLSTAARKEMSLTQEFYMSDDKAKYSPRMDPQSQQLPADFFAELFAIPGMKVFGPVMYHCDLYYRVCGHLVKYGSNGTDREGMRGASNTWLEIVAQGLSTRISRDKALIRGKSVFLSFIDDGLRRFSVEAKGRTYEEVLAAAREVIDDVIFGLRVLGRELSWDKTFISTKLFVMLNEIIYDETHFSSGLKSFCTAGDLEMKEVMSAADYEQLYFGKMRGSHGVGVPLDLCHYTYLFETLMSHHTMGLSLQDNHRINELEYRMFCVTPLALGGAGIRSPLQLACNEVAGTTKEGIGILQRLAADRPIFTPIVVNILNQELERLSPIDFMREPEQFHVAAPRVKTQRLAAEVRKHLAHIANNESSRAYIQRDKQGMELLEMWGKAFMAVGDVSAEEVRLLYASSPVAFIDEFIQKLASSTTLAEVIGNSAIARVRRAVRRDFVTAAHYFRVRCDSYAYIKQIAKNPKLVVLAPEFVH